MGYEPLHIVGSFRATMFVRDGKEVADPGSSKRSKRKEKENYFTTYGTFGPILGAVFLDTSGGGGALSWSHWEQGPEGRLAAFHFAVSSAKSHYSASTCCLPDGDGTIAFDRLVGYHGAVTIDPATGTIFRLTLQADLKGAVPLARSDVMVEYGSVQIGQKAWICPVRSVSIMRGRTVRLLRLWDDGFRTYGPFVTTLNDVTFGDYHAFAAVSHILPGYTAPPE